MGIPAMAQDASWSMGLTVSLALLTAHCCQVDYFWWLRRQNQPAKPDPDNLPPAHLYRCSRPITTVPKQPSAKYFHPRLAKDFNFSPLL
ncbi:hypothetical protein [Nodosilinea sp. E11]|uniref:hypothetical protein n=1 Tax=Nodosilinea sp. E11 TaxID=3037479 RepID=UPI00293500A3|nr:hypothetical protein [Nodosilinea sp. E11]WOD37232.1 hypothetical protein RRF56_01870 [Nodosilinea sp. E11]